MKTNTDPVSPDPAAPRARDLGWPPAQHLPTGPTNSLTDVPGVLVSHHTLIQGKSGPLRPGTGPVRTGVTAIQPHPGNPYASKVRAASHVLNGLVAAQTMRGRDSHTAHALPVDWINTRLAQA